MRQGPPAEPLAEVLLQSLRSATSRTKFSPARFFATWFSSPGGFFFLFRKNLSVTDIQYAELLALIRQYAKRDSSPLANTLSFSSPNEFKELSGSLVQQLIDVSLDVDAALRLAVELYEPIFHSLIVVRPFYGSCVAYLPPGMTIDLVSICGMSGYVHSCGPAVYIRRIEKAKSNEFFEALDNYLVQYKTADRRVVFAPFAHEDFSEFDKDRPHVREDLRHGLDDVKLYVEKMSMGTSRLVSVLEDMRKVYSDRLDIPPPGDYRVKHPSVAKNTLWLIGDHAVRSEDLRAPGEERYFICYDQWYYNDSPFFIFDENKPAWVSHTTLPHTLAAAMINVTKPWPDGLMMKMVDPFMGTGTTLLEASKENNLVISGVDIDSVAKLIASDNLEFFALSPDALGELHGFLTQLARELTDDNELGNADGELFPGPMTAYQWARRVIDGLRSSELASGGGLAFSADVLEVMKSETLTSRVVFYICLRSWIRYQAALYRGSLTWVEAFRKSASELIDELADFRDWAVRARAASDSRGHLGVFVARYSDRCAVNPHRLEKFSAAWEAGHIVYRVGDAADLQANEYDLIVTDPPYGFNTDEEFANLAQLYKRVVRALVRALRDGGQLVLSLPEASKTGRPVPLFARASTVMQHVLAEARTAGLVSLSPSATLPSPRHLFTSPYYWESEKALTRTVLHFRFGRGCHPLTKESRLAVCG